MSRLSRPEIIAGIVCLVVLVGLITAYVLRTRTRKQKVVLQDDLVERIEERLATGRFSREPSAVRRKVVDIPNDSTEPRKESKG